MLKPYQKAYLKSLANSISQHYQLGKGEVDETFLENLSKALEAKELIKVRLLPNNGSSAKDIGEALSSALDAELVQVIGRVIVLYRRSEKNPRIVVPTRREGK